MILDDKMLVEGIGGLAAACTTPWWIPRGLKIIRERRTEGISLKTQSVFAFGLALWALYGILVHNWPLLLANVTTFLLSVVILVLKLRYGRTVFASR